jgi:hypothetical protein
MIDTNDPFIRFYLAICNLTLWDTLKINTQSKDIPMMHVFVTSLSSTVSEMRPVENKTITHLKNSSYIYFLMDNILVKN